MDSLTLHSLEESTPDSRKSFLFWIGKLKECNDALILPTNKKLDLLIAMLKKKSEASQEVKPETGNGLTNGKKATLIFAAL